MNYFKNNSGDVFAYDDEQVAAGLAADKTLMTPEEVEAHLNPPPEPITQEQINAESRAYLESTDWYIIRQTETGQPAPDEILTQRQVAREAII